MSSKAASKMSPGAGLTLEISGGPDNGVGKTVQDGPVTYTVAEDKRVVRKIDRVSRTAHPVQVRALSYHSPFFLQVLIPLLMSAYCLQYVDKSAMSYAAVFSFRKGEQSSGIIIDSMKMLTFFLRLR
jgi:hypothetical protein